MHSLLTAVMRIPRVTRLWLVAAGLFVLLVHDGLSRMDAVADTKALMDIQTIPISTPCESKNAVVTLLSSANSGSVQHYFQGARMLLYQMLHNNQTRFTEQVCVVALVDSTYPADLRQQLQTEGATIVQVPHITPRWLQSHVLKRWTQNLDKLHAFRLVQYEKILMLDTDIAVVKTLEGIFEDPATRPADSDVPWLAATCDNKHQTWPSTHCERFNAGFVVFKPSLSNLRRYSSIVTRIGNDIVYARLPYLWTSRAEARDLLEVDQSLWNTVHQKGGKWAWSKLDPHFHTCWPRLIHYEQGVRALHDKYWKLKDPRLQPIFDGVRDAMRAYWQGTA